MTKLCANVQCNPSILGDQLPFLQWTLSAPQHITMSPTSSRMSINKDPCSLNLSPSLVHKSLHCIEVTTFVSVCVSHSWSFSEGSDHKFTRRFEDTNYASNTKHTTNYLLLSLLDVSVGMFNYQMPILLSFIKLYCVTCKPNGCQGHSTLSSQRVLRVPG